MQHCSVDTISFICAEETHWNTSNTDSKLICTLEMLATPVRIEFVDRWQAAWRNFQWNCLYVTQKWVKNQIGVWWWKKSWITGFITPSDFFTFWWSFSLSKWNDIPTWFWIIYCFSILQCGSGIFLNAEIKNMSDIQILDYTFVWKRVLCIPKQFKVLKTRNITVSIFLYLR